MDIERAKKEIKNAIKAYRKRDASGNLLIPVDKQRPLLMIGPPGIGKTAAVKQISLETGEGLVCYSMTHHTRQSAIGLPVTVKKVYDGRETTVTEYTMSEILSSLYDYIEESGKKEGIIFLDEVNCVSETLTPVMLQLLQNKTFGTYSLPEGWIIVAAGNPPEYNRAVRPLDMATMDRVKNLDVEADLGVWMRYARERCIHPAILAFLRVYPEYFYVVKEDRHVFSFVTARGWEDLSLMLSSLEEEGEHPDIVVFSQYLRDEQVADAFAEFYSLYSTMVPDKGEDIQFFTEKAQYLTDSGWLKAERLFVKQLGDMKAAILERDEIQRIAQRILSSHFFVQEGHLLSDKELSTHFDMLAENARTGRDERGDKLKTSLQSEGIKLARETVHRWLMEKDRPSLMDYAGTFFKMYSAKTEDERELLGKMKERCADILGRCTSVPVAQYYAEDLKTICE